MTVQLDTLDHRLLRLLDEDASMSAADLAIMLNSEEAHVASRIQAFEKSGIIKRYQAVIDWEQVDQNKSTALIQLGVTPAPDQGFDKVAERIMEFPEVQGVYLMSGSYDLTVIVEGASMRDIALFVSRRLSTLDSVLSTTTNFILTRYKDNNIVFHTGGVREDRRNVFDD